MGWKGWLAGLAFTGVLTAATLESCSDTALNEPENDRDKSTQFFGNVGKNFVENSSALLEDGAGAVIDYAESKLPDTPEGVGAAGVRGVNSAIDTLGRVFDGAVEEATSSSEPDCGDPRVMAVTIEC